MLLALIGVVVASGAAGFWLLSRSEDPVKELPQAPARRSKAGGRFAAVEIRTRSSACLAALQLQGRRYLAKNAPSLPLPECSAEHCACSFSKFRDRRTDARRLGHDGLSAALFLTFNRRARRDRRRALQWPRST